MLDMMPANWWQRLITAAVSVRYLHIGLSETANKKEDRIRRHYHETAVKRYGKHYRIKTNLPMILLAAFFVPALFIRFAFGLTTPAGAAIAFCMILTISAAYSIGIEMNIKNTIMNGEQESRDKD